MRFAWPGQEGQDRKARTEAALPYPGPDPSRFQAIPFCPYHLCSPISPCPATHSHPRAKSSQQLTMPHKVHGKWCNVCGQGNLGREWQRACRTGALSVVATPFPLSYRQPWSPSVTQRPLSYPRPVTPLGLVYTLGLGSLAPLGQLRELLRREKQLFFSLFCG